ncbi:MAG: glycosyltransferase family 39 protein [Devosiaceae bacterium]|nr:glycosyltransferase family 39 protein [Devosiaceae bacterium MH13]
MGKGRGKRASLFAVEDAAALSPALSVDQALRAGLWAPPDDLPDAYDDDFPFAAAQAGASGTPESTLLAEDGAAAEVPTETPGELAPPVKAPKPRKPAKPRLAWTNRLAKPLAAVFMALAKVRVIAALCVALVAITAFVPGFTTIPPLDRDESRFSQATRQMVATGDYVDIRFQDGPRYQKPIGIYWLQSIAVTVSGASDGQAPIWVYRTVSFAGAVAAAVLVYWLALSFGAPPVAFAAGLLVALTILLGAEARLAKTDAMLFATIMVAMAVLARAFLSKRDSAVKPWHAFAFWTASAAGILIKGPILPMVVISTAVLASLVDRRWRWLRRLHAGYGVLWLALLTVPWFVAISIASGGAFFEASIGTDLFEKIGQSRERPFMPPGMFTFAFFPGLGWPLAPLAFLSIPFAISTWHDKGTRFLVAWIVPSLLIFEFSATKLPHYILPIYPALAIFAARMIVYEKLPTGWLAGFVKFLFVLIPLAAAIGMPIVLLVYGDPIPPAGLLLGLLGAGILVLAWLFLMANHARATLVTAVVGTLVLYWGAFGHHIPAARTIWITPQLVASLDAVQCNDPELATLGYREPSLVLMTRTDLRMHTDPAQIAGFLAEPSCRAAFITEPEATEALRVLREANVTIRSVGRVEGLNINGGDELTIVVVTNDPSVTSG